MDKFHQELFDVLTRCRNARVSKAASVAASVQATNKPQRLHKLLDNDNKKVNRSTEKVSTYLRFNHSTMKFKKEKRKLPHINGVYS
jgi:hypothetical protein